VGDGADQRRGGGRRVLGQADGVDPPVEVAHAELAPRGVGDPEPAPSVAAQSAR
jgi:hypothetical protein